MFERHIGSPLVRVLALGGAVMCAVAVGFELSNMGAGYRSEYRAAALIAGLLMCVSGIFWSQRVYDAWITFAERVHVAATTITYGAVYFVIVPVFSLIVRAQDPLQLRRASRGRESYWIARKQRERDARDYERMA